MMCIVLCISVFVAGQAPAQFRENFNGPAVALDPEAVNGWAFYTGDGSAVMDLRQQQGHAAVVVDATGDRRNIWWALIRRCVSTEMDLAALALPDREFRIAARIRVSHAPRRVNLHLNTQRTTDFHSHLMEFDIPDTLNWHAISMTTRDFDARPGDRVYGQLALMDWGLEKYRVDVDYLAVDIVDRNACGPDQGVQVPYHPPVPKVETFTHHLPAGHAAMIDRGYPDVRFHNWRMQEATGIVRALTVSAGQLVILRWDRGAFAGKRAAAAGLLELSTCSLLRSADYPKDFGMVRVVEILGGDPEWQQENTTFNSLCQGRPFTHVMNSQMIIDVAVAPGRGARNLITVSQPVLQRLIDGRTLGLAIMPLGAVQASFYADDRPGETFRPRLHARFETD